MLQYRTRFLSNAYYDAQNADIFFGRKEEIRLLYQMAGFEENVILHSKPATGKSSILKAGLIPLMTNSNNIDVVYVDFKEVIDSENTINDFLFQIIKNFLPAISYTDKLFNNTNDIWVALKKYESNSENSKKIAFIFDSVEYILVNPQKSDDFFDICKRIYSENIPSDLQNEINQNLDKNPDLLTSEGKQLLSKKPVFKAVFSINTQNLNTILNKGIFIPDFGKNIIELKDFSTITAAEIISKALAYNSKYSEKNNFSSQAVYFDKKNILELFRSTNSNDKINAFDIQTIGSFLEENPELQNNITINEIIEHYSKHAFTQLTDEAAQELIDFCKATYETGDNFNNIPINLSSAKKYFPGFYDNLSSYNKFFNFGISENLEKYAFLKSKFLFDSILNKSNEKLQNRNIEINKIPKQKISAKTKYLISSFAIIFLISIVGLFFINSERKKSKKSELTALSNMYSAYSFRYTHTDPTVSFRYAEHAYALDRSNYAAYSALLNSYYAGEVFYSILKEYENKILASKFSSSSKYYALLCDKNDNYIIKVCETEKNELFEIQTTKPVTTLGFSKDSKIFYYADKSGKIYLYNLTGIKIKEIQAHKSMVWLVKFSNDNSKLISSGDYSLILNDLQTGEQKILAESDFDLYAADFSADNKFIAAAQDSKIIIFDTKGQFLREIDAVEPNTYFEPIIQSIVFSPVSNDLLIVVNDLKGRNSFVEILDINTKTAKIFRGHSDWINTANYSADGKKIITCSHDNTAKVWKIEGSLEGELKGHKSNVLDVAFSENSYTVFSVSSDRTVRKWSFGRLLNPLAELVNVDYSLFSPDGLKILTAVDTIIKLHDFTGDVEREFLGNKKKIKQLNFSTDGQYILSAGSDSKVRVWNLLNGNNYTSSFHSSAVNSAAFMPDSNYVVSGGNDSLIVFWRPGDKNAIQIIKCDSKINSVCFSPDKKMILSAESSGKVILRNLKGQIIKEIQAHPKNSRTAVFSPNQQFIASTGNDYKASLWTLNGENVRNFEGFESKVNSIEFSTDGRFILTASDDRLIKIYELSGNELFRYTNSGKVLNAKFSADGKYIISNINDRGQKISKIIVISPGKILELTNDIKIFGDFLTIDTLNPEKLQKNK